MIFSFMYMFCRSLFVLLAIVLSVLLWFTDSDYPFGIFWPLFCLFFFDLLILIRYLQTLLINVIIFCLVFFCRCKRKLTVPFAPGIKVEPKLFVVSHDAKLLITCGHWDNSLQVYNLGKSKKVNHIVRHIGMYSIFSLLTSIFLTGMIFFSVI